MEGQIGIYQIFGEIGRGATGSVHKAQNMMSKKDLCVKIIEKNSLATKEDMDFFRREIHILSTLHHQNIVEYEDLLEDDKFYYIIQAYCEGKTRTNYITETPRFTERALETIY